MVQYDKKYKVRRKLSLGLLRGME